MAHLAGVSLILVLVETLMSEEAINGGGIQRRSQAPTVSQASRGGSVGSTPPINCYRCGRPGHRAYQCEARDVTCFRCNERGHISHDCPRTRQESATASGSASGSASKPKATGRVFALSGTEAAQSDDLIQGMCFIDGTPLIMCCMIL
ncbi:gag-pol, partial [Mucuna pruriens]